MRRAVEFLVLLGIAGMLPACSTMPSWTKPSVWYDQVTGDPKAVEKAAAEDAAKAALPVEPESEFPNLAKSPTPPAPGLTEAQQREIRDSLAADRAATKAAVEAVKTVETPETRASGQAKSP